MQVVPLCKQFTIDQPEPHTVWIEQSKAVTKMLDDFQKELDDAEEEDEAMARDVANHPLRTTLGPTTTYRTTQKAQAEVPAQSPAAR